MFNKITSITFSDANTIKEIYPTATLHQLIKLRRSGMVEDIRECQTLFPQADINGTSAIVGSRSFVRWCVSHKKIISLCLAVVPVFGLTLFGLKGAFALDLLTSPLAVPAFPGVIPQIINPFPNAVTTLAPATVAVSAKAGGGFFNGNGIILLHIMLIGFFTLVVSSFLKFTGRGDMIPLVAFIGGAIILKEVIGLFNQIYSAIQTLLNM